MQLFPFGIYYWAIFNQIVNGRQCVAGDLRSSPEWTYKVAKALLGNILQPKSPPQPLKMNQRFTLFQI